MLTIGLILAAIGAIGFIGGFILPFFRDASNVESMILMCLSGLILFAGTTLAAVAFIQMVIAQL